jgi:hypothetical protein
MEEANTDTLQEARQALAEAEAFGDNFGIVCGLWSYALMLLRLNPEASENAEALLRRALAIISKYNTATITAAPIKADVAYIMARAGDLDGAIDLIRDELGQQFEDSNFTFVGATATALVQLLAARATADDIEEAIMLTDALDAVAKQTQLGALDNCVLLSRCVLARQSADHDAYRAAFTARREVRERLSATGEFPLLTPLPEIT